MWLWEGGGVRKKADSGGEKGLEEERWRVIKRQEGRERRG